MAANTPVYSSVSGPAKWAAVVVLSLSCGAGLMYAAIGRVPRNAAGAATVPRESQLPPVAAKPAAPISAIPQSAAALSGSAGVAAPAPAAILSAPAVTPSPALPATTEPAPVDRAAATPPAPVPAPAPVVAPSPVTPAPIPTPAPEVRKGHLININTAGQAELELLPRIGPAIAQRIIDYRVANGPFRAPSDLDKVKGIGPKTLEKLLPLVTVE